MSKAKNIITTTTTSLACFAAIIVVFHAKIVPPPIVQVIGRLHPMLVHFPVALFVLLFAYELLLKKRIESETAANISYWMVLLTALSCVLSVIAGVILSREGGYEADAISDHMWFGVGFTAFMLLWLAFFDKVHLQKTWNVAFCSAGFLLNLFAGHMGANITHGTDFVYAPVLKEKTRELVPIEDALVYRDMVQPILDEKCMSCHNEKKAKGNLVMATEAALLKGGKGGTLWNLEDPDLGLMLRRIHLPEDQKKHMPPTGKTQLTDEEISILTYWIKKGSDFTLKVASLQPTDSLYMLAKKIFSNSENEVYDFAAADEKKIESLNTPNRLVQSVAMESPALTVSFFGASQFKPEQLNDLLDVKQQIVSLNLEKMPLNADGYKTISQFSNLRKLNLSFTPVTGNDLAFLNKLPQLKSLALANVKLNTDDVKKICALPQMKELFLWNSGIDSNTIAALKNAYKKVNIDEGFNGTAIVLPLNPPIIQTEERVIRDTLGVKIKHYVNGAMLHYTLDGTDPDSLSPVYKGSLVLNNNATLKVKAYKPGWIASEIVETYFFKNTHPGDTAFALTQPDNSYKANGAKTLIDGIKGDKEFRSGKWLGYKDTHLETVVGYKEPFTINSITLSTLVDIGSYIMPAKTVLVYGGMDKDHLQLLGQVSPSQPKEQVAVYLTGIEVKCKPTQVKFLKIVANPVSKLPPWHRGAGDKGWVFADELFVN